MNPTTPAKRIQLWTAVALFCCLVISPDSATADEGSALDFQMPKISVPKADAKTHITIISGPYSPWWSDDADERNYTRRWVHGTGQSSGKAWQHDAEDWAPMLTQVEYAKNFFDFFGPVGYTVSVGYWEADGQTHYCEDSATGEPTSCPIGAVTDGTITTTEGNSKSSLTMMPFSGGIQYRFDALRTRYGIPLMLIGKGGLNLTYFRATSGGKVLTRTQGDDEVSLSGFRAGYYATLGAALNLDWLDPSTGKPGSAIALTATHLVLEMTWMQAIPLGTYADKADTSDNSAYGLVQLGLQFDFGAR